MADDMQPPPYRLFGAEDSAFSTKLRLYLHYKQAQYEWVARSAENEQTLRTVARFDTLPVLVTPSGYAAHDTSSMMEALETDLSTNGAVPDQPGAGFLSSLLEEYADSWMNKAMIQYRWTRKRERKKAATRAVSAYFPDQSDNRDMEQKAVEWMTSSLKLIGLNDSMTAIVETSFKNGVSALATHLTQFPYLLGGRPCLADFAVAGQLIQMQKDAAAAKIIAGADVALSDWCARMRDPKIEGEYADTKALADSLHPFFTGTICVFYLPWAAANTEAVITRKDMMELTIGKRKIAHRPIKSEAGSFRELRRKFTALDDSATVDFLKETGAAPYLQRPRPVPKES